MIRSVLVLGEHICPVAVTTACRTILQLQICGCYLHIPRVVKQSSTCPSRTWVPSCSAIKFLHRKKGVGSATGANMSALLITAIHLTVAAQGVPVDRLPQASAMQERLIARLELSQQLCQVAWKQHPCLQNGVKLLLQCLSAALYSLLDFGWVASFWRCANPAY